MKFSIITLGCKVNAYESNYIKESLVNNGFSFCEEYKNADIIIINTCTVTDTSDKKSLKTFRRIKRENPKAITIICGCSVQYNSAPYEVLNADIIIGNQKKSELVFLIKDYLTDHKKYKYISNDRKLPFEDMQITKFDHVRAYIKVQDGCNNFCSYCIIPYVRGDLRCKKFECAIREAEELVKNGYQEIVLTGIHTGSYIDGGKDLCDLMAAMSKIPGLKRLRLSSVEITELNDKFLNLLKTNNVICDHLHIPLQTGCDEMLKVMNRKYDTSYYRDKIASIRKIRPNISITTDVIVGHNFETEELFAKTYAFCKEIGFAKIHVFPYSKRTGTRASFMDGEVNENIKKERARKLIALSEDLEQQYYNQFLGQELEVLIEKVTDCESYGHTSNYLMVKFAEKLEVNKIYKRKV